MFNGAARSLKNLFASHPDRHWKIMMDQYLEYTPDSGTLTQNYCQFLFVYDRLMRQFDEHQVIEQDAIPLGLERAGITAYTQGSYGLWQQNLGKASFPLALTSQSKDIMAPPSRIRGELYAIRPYRFLTLDKAYQNGVQFKRERVKLVLPYRDVRWFKEGDEMAGRSGMDSGCTRVSAYNLAKSIDAWMYVGVTDHWNDLLDGGYHFSPVKRIESRTPWLGHYYYFKKEG